MKEKNGGPAYPKLRSLSIENHPFWEQPEYNGTRPINYTHFSSILTKKIIRQNNKKI